MRWGCKQAVILNDEEVFGPEPANLFVSYLTP